MSTASSVLPKTEAGAFRGTGYTASTLYLQAAWHYIREARTRAVGVLAGTSTRIVMSDAVTFRDKPNLTKGRQN